MSISRSEVVDGRSDVDGSLEILGSFDEVVVAGTVGLRVGLRVGSRVGIEVGSAQVKLPGVLMHISMAVALQSSFPNSHSLISAQLSKGFPEYPILQEQV